MNVWKLANVVGLRTGNRFSEATASPSAFPKAMINAVTKFAGARPLAMIILLNLVLLGSGSWLLPLVDRDEPRFAEASREMLARHDWAVPWFNGQYRFDKPPLIYWCQMLCYRVFGEDALAARLPGIVFATGIAVVLFYWGRRLGGEGLGKRAAIYFSTCVAALVYGRLAFADMPMIFFVTLATWSGWELTRPDAKEKIRWWMVFCLSLGLGFLAKGPVAWLPVVGLFVARLARPNEYAWPAKLIWGGVMAAILIVAFWGVPALMATEGEYFKVGIGHHVIFRSVHALDGHGGSSVWSWIGSAFFYIPVLMLGLFPWSLWLPKALKQWRLNGSLQDGLGSYLLIQSLLVLVVFTFVRTKLPHYILPAFPCIALWLARQTLFQPTLITVRKHSSWVLGMAVVTIALTTGGFLLARPAFVASSLFKQCRPMLKPEMRFATVDYSDPSLVWEFHSLVTNNLQVLPAGEAAKFLTQPGPLVLLIPGKFGSGRLATIPTNGCTVAAASGFDLPHGKRLEISALIRPE